MGFVLPGKRSPHKSTFAGKAGPCKRRDRLFFYPYGITLYSHNILGCNDINACACYVRNDHIADVNRSLNHYRFDLIKDIKDLALRDNFLCLYGTCCKISAVNLYDGGYYTGRIRYFVSCILRHHGDRCCLLRL